MTNLRQIMPGLALAIAVAVASLYAADLPAMKHLGFSALTIAILGGMLIGNTVYRYFAGASHHGIQFSKQKLLRLGIILFGFKLTFQDIAAVGFAGVLIDTLVLCTTFLLAFRIGRKYLGMDEQSVILIGAGSSICGAAAILATEPVIKAHAEKVAVAVATVVVFGTVAMFLWPMLYQWTSHLGISEFNYGVFAGSTIHEVAQAVAAGKSVSEAAMTTAVITKMIRVMMLAPFLIALSSWLAAKPHGSRQQKSGIAIPWFAVAFLAVAAFNSFNLLPAAWVSAIVSLDNLLLAAAMGALGITTHFSAIRQAGAKPMLLASILFGWLIVGGGLINFGVSHLLH